MTGTMTRGFPGEDGLVVAYVGHVGCLEIEDFESARAGMAEREFKGRWQPKMGDFFVLRFHRTGIPPDRAMQPLEEAFYV